MRRTLPFIVAVFLIVALAASTWAATLSQQRRELSKANTSLRAAERMARASRNEDAAAAFNEAAATIAELAGDLDDKLSNTFERTKQQLADTHSKLTASGVELPPLEDLKPTAKQEPNLTRPRGGQPGMSGQVSFVDQIVPIFTSNCGGCHTQQSKGGFNLATYNKLMQGSRSGNVIELGAGFESLLLTVIANGEMPPSGDQVPPEQVALLNKWINQRAPFDGDDANKPIAELAKQSAATTPQPGTAPPDRSTPDSKPIPIPMAKGGEKVSFAVDIAPHLTATCSGCHLGDNVRAGFSIANFTAIWAGGDSGMVVVPGDPERSLLVQKLHGTAVDGRQMPLNLPAWSNDKIALVEKWISEGATFDGPDVNESTARVSQLVRAERATPQQLSQMRAEIAADQWHLAVPDEQASQAFSDRFLVVGNLPESQLEQLAGMAEGEAGRVLAFFKQQGSSLNKSRITLFSFAKRIDYSEFGTMVERRQFPRGARAHATFDIVAPYAAIYADEPNTDQTSRLVAQHLATLWVADQAKGRAPRWFAQGTGMAAAAKLWPKDEEVSRWRDELSTAISSTAGQPDAFIDGKLPPTITDLLSFGFVEGLMQKRRNFDNLLGEMANGASFDEACQTVFKRTPAELAGLWVKSQSGRR